MIIERQYYNNFRVIPNKIQQHFYIAWANRDYINDYFDISTIVKRQTYSSFDYIPPYPIRHVNKFEGSFGVLTNEFNSESITNSFEIYFKIETSGYVDYFQVLNRNKNKVKIFKRVENANI